MRDIGLITSNPTKVKVLEVLKKKERADARTISKSIRVPEIMLKGVLEELKHDGFVIEEEGIFSLSPSGLEVLMKMKL
jgi:predicted transcriptional regulator